MSVNILCQKKDPPFNSPLNKGGCRRQRGSKRTHGDNIKYVTCLIAGIITENKKTLRPCVFARTKIFVNNAG